MLKKTERVKRAKPTKTTETLAELLAKVGAIKVKSYQVTPEQKPKKEPEEKEQPSSLKL